MQVGCKSIGQDDCHDSGNRGSVTPHSLLTKRPSQESEKQPTQLGEELSLVLYEHGRTPMVEGVCDDKKWLSCPSYTFNQSKDVSLCRCIRYGLGCCINLIKSSGFWSMEERQISISLRELKAIWFALQLHAEKCHHSIIQIFSDNRTAIKHIIKAGRFRRFYS
jgi:hypothetical protein